MPKGETDLYERPRAVAQEMLRPERHLDRALDSTERSMVSANAFYRCAGRSRRTTPVQPRPLPPTAHTRRCRPFLRVLRLRSGLVSSLGAGVVSGAMVAAANAFSPRFRGALGVSGKAALVVTPTVGAFSLASHLSIGNVAKDGGTSIAGAAAAAPVAKVSSLPLWCRASNMVYINPFKTILGICLPAYGALFYRESTHPATANMLLSQRLIHTRVYGQVGLGVRVRVRVRVRLRLRLRLRLRVRVRVKVSHSGSSTRASTARRSP